jgi:hypothetical protein
MRRNGRASPSRSGTSITTLEIAPAILPELLRTPHQVVALAPPTTGQRPKMLLPFLPFLL